MENKRNKKIYKTTSFYLSCYLICQGVKLIGLNKPAGSTRAYFVFVDSPEISKSVEEFNFNPDLTVNLKDFIEAMRQLKTILHEQAKFEI